MPRVFVNSMANFVIHGGMVSFTLQDQAMTTDGGQPRPAEPEEVVNVAMTEQDFANLLAFFNTHAEAFEQQTGRKLGAPAQAPQADAPRRPATAPPTQGMKIRPKKG